ncbi:MAG: acylphosphatase [Candidatus Zixiibacteriota bacterium]
MATVAAEVRIRGMVQGVGYRYFCLRLADQLGLTGWVRNDPDGSVLVHAEGDQSLIEQLLSDLKVGPPASSVNSLDIVWSQFTGAFARFDVRS